MEPWNDTPGGREEPLSRNFEESPLTAMSAGPMSAGSGTAARPFWVRFFDTFFQERNIQWILGVGMLILLGSSLMLVTSHWDTYTPFWKHLILLSYTAGLHAVGQASYHWLSLRKTGTGLMALTVLLIPLSFLSMRWIYPDESLVRIDLLRHAGLLALLAANTVFAVAASSRIFRHFLRTTQPTFVAAYIVLSVAGAFVPSLPAAAAPFVTPLLWLVFAAGAVKVNRHVFWLTEEHRLPRIVGFLPILLLGAQFLALFAAGLASHLTLEWIGLGCVLTAAPVLLTADALARVFQERNGAAARPLPWSIILPIVVALVMTIAGLVMAALRFPAAPILVPTAGIAAVLMGVVAHRTGKSAFVWAMLAGVLLAYQCSPVFFRELARQAVAAGAAAVQEQRLPVAFYGLTYLPLLLTTTLLAARGRSRNERLFAPVLKRFSSALPALLLAAATTHAKALFPVSLAIASLWGLQAVLFRDRRILAAVVVSWLLAGLGFTPFAESVLSLGKSAELPLLAWTFASVTLLLPGTAIDRITARWRASDAGREAIPLFQLGSFVATVATACGWVLQVVSQGDAAVGPIAGTVVSLLMLWHAARWRVAGLSDVAVAFPIAVVTMTVWANGWALLDAANLAALLMAILWFVSPVLRRSAGAVRTLFADAAGRVSSMGLTLAMAGVVAPRWIGTLLWEEPFTPWLLAIVGTAWAFDAGRRFQSAWMTAIGWVSLLATAGSVAVDAFGLSREWTPTLWGLMGLGGVGVSALVAKSSVIPQFPGMQGEQQAASYPDVAVSPVAVGLRRSVLAILAMLAVFTLFRFDTPMRVAGGVSLVGLLSMAALWRNSTTRLLALIVANWQILCGVLQAFAPATVGLDGLSLSDFIPAALPIAMASAVQSLAWQRSLRRNIPLAEFVMVQRFALFGACGASLLCALRLVPQGAAGWHVALAVATFAVLVADRLVTALRSGEAHVWAAEALVAAGLAYLWLFGAIRFGHGLSQFLILGAGVLAWSISRWAAHSEEWRVLARPLSITGFALPAATVLLGIVRHFIGPAPMWLGMNSLALLLAAGFYFWQGLEQNHKGMLIGSAAILNASLAMLWRELSWSDPQLFLIPIGVSVLWLVELLRSEIPASWHNPLRYAGALVILVSPTFHIVGGSWLHLFSLMLVSVFVILAAMGLRLRALMYLGTAFLIADLVAMVVRGSVDEPSILWIAGIALGIVIISLGAYCERHRERMLQRLRLIAAELESWN